MDAANKILAGQWLAFAFTHFILRRPPRLDAEGKKNDDKASSNGNDKNNDSNSNNDNNNHNNNSNNNNNNINNNGDNGDNSDNSKSPRSTTPTNNPPPTNITPPSAVCKSLVTLPNWLHKCLVAAVVVFLLQLPLVINPLPYPMFRFYMGMLSFVFSSHVIEIAYGRYYDASMHTSFFRAMLYFFTGADTKMPATPEERTRMRKYGVYRFLVHGVGHIAFSALWLWVKYSVFNNFEGYHWFAFNAWLSISFFFLMSSFFNLPLGLFQAMTGMWVADAFRWPILANSIQDLWSRRWNMTFRDIVHRLIFEVMDPKKHPVVAAMSVFLFSGLIHEYLVWLALPNDFGKEWGYMTAFFVIHGIATVGYVQLRRWNGKRPFLPFPIDVVVTVVSLSGLLPLFFHPMRNIFPFWDQRLWKQEWQMPLK